VSRKSLPLAGILLLVLGLTAGCTKPAVPSGSETVPPPPGVTVPAGADMKDPATRDAVLRGTYQSPGAAGAGAPSAPR